MNINEQFAGLKVPEDITALPVFTLEELQSEINKTREINKRPEIDLSGKICLNYNSQFFRANEINIQTVALDFNYEADFNWTDVNDELDPWRKTCRLKANFQRFVGLGIDSIRSEDFIHKLHICESYTFFEDSFKMLQDDGVLTIKYLDLIALFEDTIKQEKNIKALEKLEKKIFTPTDPSGLYYNKTLLTFERLEFYLKRSGFKTVQKDIQNSDEFNVQIVAYKQ
jgi:hypothetical protein